MAAASAGGGKKGPTPAPIQHDDAKRVQELQKKQIAQRTLAHKQVPLFAHLPQYEREASLSGAAVAKGSIHPAVLRLGLQMAEGVGEGIASGSNARVVSMLRAFQAVVRDFTCPPSKVLSRELETSLKEQIQYLVDCRPMSMAMGNAIKWLKMRMGHVPPHLVDDDAKQVLCEMIDTFMHERIVLADQVCECAHMDMDMVHGDAFMHERIVLADQTNRRVTAMWPDRGRHVAVVYPSCTRRVPVM